MTCTSSFRVRPFRRPISSSADLEPLHLAPPEAQLPGAFFCGASERAFASIRAQPNGQRRARRECERGVRVKVPVSARKLKNEKSAPATKGCLPFLCPLAGAGGRRLCIGIAPCSIGRRRPYRGAGGLVGGVAADPRARRNRAPLRASPDRAAPLPNRVAGRGRLQLQEAAMVRRPSPRRECSVSARAGRLALHPLVAFKAASIGAGRRLGSLREPLQKIRLGPTELRCVWHGRRFSFAAVWTRWQDVGR